MSEYTAKTEAELRIEMLRLENELERRRLEEHAGTPAVVPPSEDDFALLDRKWSNESFGGELTEGHEAKTALTWLWNGTVFAHENAYGSMPSTGHVASVIVDRLADLLLAAGGEDATDLRDTSEPPSFGGRGCLCEMYDDGGPEYGPKLGVDINEQCPLHSHLLEQEAEQWPVPTPEAEAPTTAEWQES